LCRIGEIVSDNCPVAGKSLPYERRSCPGLSDRANAIAIVAIVVVGRMIRQ
jgi:hypothetical protein